MAVAACGDPPAGGAEPTATLPPVTEASAPLEEPTLVAATEPDAEPDAEPVQRRDEPSAGTADIEHLSIADALLPDAALGPPWEIQSREIDRVGQPPGPNQTSCDEYWTLESILGRDGGVASWWRDGGNADHHVVRVADEADLLVSLQHVARIADACPVVKWIEGGSFRTEMIELADGIGLRLEAVDHDEITVVVLTAHGDLLSVLRMPLWAAADGVVPEPSHDELEALASLMFDRLASAGPSDVPGAPATTTTAPPPVTSQPTGLGALLLTADELPDRWRLTSVEPYVADGSDDELVDQCPAAASIERVDAGLAWEANFRTASDDGAFELIGALESSRAAIEAVEDFGRIAECDLSELMPGAAWSGGLEDVSGADRAARLTAEVDLGGDDRRFDLVLLAIDSIVIVVSYEGRPADAELVLDLAARAAARAAAG
jgi:hypothetical protein